MVPCDRHAFATKKLGITRAKLQDRHAAAVPCPRANVDPPPAGTIVRPLVPLWRNWYTRLTQNQVAARSCWFESGQGHQFPCQHGQSWRRCAKVVRAASVAAPRHEQGERSTYLQHDKSPYRRVQAVRNSAAVRRPSAAHLQRKDGRRPPLVIASAADSGAATRNRRLRPRGERRQN